MSHNYSNIILITCICLITCCSQPAKQTVDTPKSTTPRNIINIKSQGKSRNLLYHIPSQYSANVKVPLVIVLHGETNAESIKKISGWDKKADEQNFIVVYPNALKKHWNDGSTFMNKQNIDDVLFISETIDHMQKKFAIDEKKIYATGFSNGAMMCFRLACELSDKITAVAPVIGSISQNYRDNAIPKKAIPIIMINSTDDPVIPWKGGNVTLSKQNWGKAISIAEVVSFWVTNNNCFSLAETRTLPNTNTTDGTKVKYKRHHAKENGKEVMLYTVEGGGHTWPGGPQYMPEPIIGKVNHDVDAIEIIWDFFVRNSLE